MNMILCVCFDVHWYVIDVNSCLNDFV